jgi:hypothetical protein
VAAACAPRWPPCPCARAGPGPRVARHLVRHRAHHRRHDAPGVGRSAHRLRGARLAGELLPGRHRALHRRWQRVGADAVAGGAAGGVGDADQIGGGAVAPARPERSSSVSLNLHHKQWWHDDVGEDDAGQQHARQLRRRTPQRLSRALLSLNRGPKSGGRRVPWAHEARDGPAGSVRRRLLTPGPAPESP